MHSYGYRSLLYRAAHAVLVCFDLTDIKSWRNVKQWLQDIDRYGRENNTVLIVGCKADLTTERAVESSTVLELCSALNRSYVETSAKSGMNVDEVMMQAIHDAAAGSSKKLHDECGKHCLPTYSASRPAITMLLCVYYYTGAHITVLPVEVMQMVVSMLPRNEMEEVKAQVWARRCEFAHVDVGEQWQYRAMPQPSQPQRRTRCAVF